MLPPPQNWLVCDGGSFSQSDYPALYKVLGKTTLPDMREAALVGIGQRASGVAAHDTYTLGQFKDDQFASHTHTQNAHSHTFKNQVQNAIVEKSNVWFFAKPLTVLDSLTRTDSVTATNQNTGATSGGTHGKRFGVNYIIKAK